MGMVRFTVADATASRYMVLGRAFELDKFSMSFSKADGCDEGPQKINIKKSFFFFFWMVCIRALVFN